VDAPRNGRVDARDAERIDAAARALDPILEDIERGRFGVEIVHRLLEADAAAVDDDLIEMAVVQIRMRRPAGARCECT
jgi:hypothetical protein